MSNDRGKRAARWVAGWLGRWWPSAEATPGGRNGVDILGTPGVCWEVKTEADWRPAGALAQAARNAHNHRPCCIHGPGPESLADALRRSLQRPAPIRAEDIPPNPSGDHECCRAGIPIVIYLPPGVGADTVGARAHIVMAPEVVMGLLVAAGYAPAPITESE